MKNENEKGFFARLIAGSKAKKDSCCCNIEIEEIPEENTNIRLAKGLPQQSKTAPAKKGGCDCNGGCC